MSDHNPNIILPETMSLVGNSLPLASKWKSLMGCLEKSLRKVLRNKNQWQKKVITKYILAWKWGSIGLVLVCKKTLKCMLTQQEERGIQMFLQSNNYSQQWMVRNLTQIKCLQRFVFCIQICVHRSGPRMVSAMACLFTHHSRAGKPYDSVWKRVQDLQCIPEVSQ